MFTVPQHRGHGHGLAVITELELRATRVGARRAILETGVRNTSALNLYVGMGYEETERYVAGRDPEINRAFVKALSIPSTS
jgi:ribosomal protein S18 acetylase RimI-like enzyme